MNSMTKAAINYKSIYYPPGGILMWIIIFLELFTFGIALIAMVFSSKENPELFHDSRLLLNTTYGMVNTIFLLTSGYFMAIAVSEFKRNKLKKTKLYLGITMGFGVLFLALKGVEYFEKIEAGITISYNTFFNYYWMLTLFHVIHVIVGLVILSSLYYGISRPKMKLEDVEASAAFWHMCDLIWLLLFPIIYLLF